MLVVPEQTGTIILKKITGQMKHIISIAPVLMKSSCIESIRYHAALPGAGESLPQRKMKDRLCSSSCMHCSQNRGTNLYAVRETDCPAVSGKREVRKYERKAGPSFSFRKGSLRAARSRIQTGAVYRAFLPKVFKFGGYWMFSHQYASWNRALYNAAFRL